jgi:predicted GTPase
MGWSSRLLRWQVLLAVLALCLPFVAGFAIGMVYLWQLRLMWVFASVSVALVALAAMARWVLQRRLQTQTVSQTSLPADPGWSDAEARAYVAAQAIIARELAEPVAWDALPRVIETLVAQVAADSGKQGKGVWDFTLPEALLLINRVSERLRDDMRRLVPFSDTVSVRNLIWVWRNRQGLQKAATIGQGVWRAQRFLFNPPAAILREMERQIAGPHTKLLTDEGIRALQKLMLEEIAQVAIDLYSGRLRFSDAELAHTHDPLAEIAPDRPLRIAIAGQENSGKSMLVNALSGGNMTEPDIVTTTQGLHAYRVDLNGYPVELMDMPGLDGSDVRQKACLADLERADLVLWVMRADRPGRDLDDRFLEQWQTRMTDDPQRRSAKVLAVVTAVDRLVRDWPFPEHDVPAPARALFAELQEAVTQDLPTLGEAPILVVACEPAWNIEALGAAIAKATPNAIQVQRNRLRRAAMTQNKGLAQEALRVGRGIKAAAAQVLRD